MVAYYKNIFIFVFNDLPPNCESEKVRKLIETCNNAAKDILLFSLNKSMSVNCTCLALDVILISNVALSEIEFDTPEYLTPT